MFQEYRQESEEYNYCNNGRYQVNDLGQTGLIFTILNDDFDGFKKIFATIPSLYYINKKDAFAKSVLDYAVQWKRLTMLQALIGAGAKIGPMTLTMAAEHYEGQIFAQIIHDLREQEKPKSNDNSNSNMWHHYFIVLKIS